MHIYRSTKQNPKISTKSNSCCNTAKNAEVFTHASIFILYLLLLIMNVKCYYVFIYIVKLRSN